MIIQTFDNTKGVTAVNHFKLSAAVQPLHDYCRCRFNPPISKKRKPHVCTESNSMSASVDWRGAPTSLYNPLGFRGFSLIVARQYVCVCVYMWGNIGFMLLCHIRVQVVTHHVVELLTLEEFARRRTARCLWDGVCAHVRAWRWCCVYPWVCVRIIISLWRGVWV